MIDITKEAASKETELVGKCKDKAKTPGKLKLESWLNACMKIEMTDGRTLIGQFLCTDRDANVILGSCYEYIPPDEDGNVEERVLGLAMIPGKHVVSIAIDDVMLASQNSSYVT